MKKNCWEFKQCGRETGGKRVHDLGVCPASREVKLDGVHGGRNAGRSCWVVAGTFCNGEIQGSFGKKYKTCEKCDFYQLVKKEETVAFKLSAVLLSELTGKIF